MEDLSSFSSTSSTSQEDHESNSGSTSSRKLKVTLLSSGWRSTKGGVSTINRELAIQLAKHPSVEVRVYLPQCSEEDKKDGARYNVLLIKAEAIPGFDNGVDWLSFLPEGHAVDCVIGYGVVLGRQVQLIKCHHNCNWIHIVHTAPEELGMYRSDAILRAEKLRQDEVKLCEDADQVVAVGPKLADVFRGYLRSCGKDQDVLNLTPGIFSEFADVKQATEERKTFSVLVFGSDDNVDFKLNGYDIAARAIAELKDEPQSYKLLFVGVPQGEEEKVKDLLLQRGINRRQLTVRCFCESREELARLFCEVDLAIMPSQTEGFGLAALEALSAGLPVLVSGNSGLGEALKGVLYGSSCVEESDDPKVWAKAIKAVRQKDRKMRLNEIQIVRNSYALKYNWGKECDKLVERMSNITRGGFHATVPEPFVSSKPGEASNLYGDIAVKKHSILASECRRRSDRRPFPAEKPRREKEALISLSKVNSIPGDACMFPHSDWYVHVPPLEIFVQVMHQEIITLEVDSSDTIGNLKEKIKDKKGFPVEEQLLFFQSKTQLKDDRTVSDYNIQNKSTVKLSLQIYRLEVTILTEGRRPVTLEVNATDSILELKREIQDMTGVPLKQQCLSFAGIELENERTIFAYNIQNKSSINLVVKVKVYLVTPLNQEKMTLVLKPNDDIGSVKDKIYAQTKISSHRQVLKFNGKELDDVHTLKYYNIDSKSKLFLYEAIKIFVEMLNGTVVTLKLSQSNTIEDVKVRLNLREDIPWDVQRLSFRGKPLRHSDTLRDLNIQNNSILRYVVMITIHIKMPNEDEISVDVNLDDNIRSVRDRIQAEGAIPPDQLCLLVYNGEKLNNRYTLRHYKVRNGSILSLVKSGVGNLDLRVDGRAQRPREASSNQPSTQDVLNRIAEKCFEKVDPSNPDELNGFLKYLKEVRKVLVLDVKTGSLIFTLECGSLEILDDLWEEYNTGHLNEVAQLYLVTNDILEEFDLSSFKLESFIKYKEYRACRQRLAIEETASKRSLTVPPEVIINQLKNQDLPKSVTHFDDCQLPVDILLLTVEDCEFLSCLSYLNPGFFKTFHDDLGFVYLGDMGEDERKLSIAVMNCYRGSASPGGSMIVVLNAVNVLRPKAVFCVGSCRSLDYDKVKPGDIVMLEKLITYGPCKITEGGIEERGFKVPLKSGLLKVKLRAGDGWKPPLKDPKALEVKIHHGTILSGPVEVIDSPEHCKAFIERFPEAVAMEEEGEGVFAAAHGLDIEWIVIKGISDYAGGSKSMETSWRPFASLMAASVTAHILSDAIIFEDWPHFKSKSVEKSRMKRDAQIPWETTSERSTPVPPEVIINLLKKQDLPQSVTHLDDCQLPVDILLLTVEDCEFLSCLSYLNPGFCKTFHRDLGFVYLGDMGKDERKLNIAVMSCHRGAVTPGGSVVVVLKAVNVLRPKAVFCVGSCRSLGYDKVKLGDIVMFEKLITSGPCRITEGGIEERGVKVPLKSRLLKVIPRAGDGWKPPLKDPKAAEVKIHRGTILSGPIEVIDSPKHCKALIDRFPEAVAMDEEGEGVFAAAHDLGIEWIVIKGISDYAGGSKSKESSWRPFASLMAASVTAHILSNAIIFEDWPHFESTSVEKSRMKRDAQIPWGRWFDETNTKVVVAGLLVCLIAVVLFSKRQ